MFQNLDTFKTAMSMARHAGLKQAVTSQNVANADTPNYRAKTVAAFSDIAPGAQGGFALKVTRHTHIDSTRATQVAHNVIRTNQEPNGNGVDLETEILNSVAAKRQHDRALAVYRASLGMLRAALSKQ
ncbi:FlgB family protein [Marivita sp. S6314]|uniref:FlgB family protein n=1 Tax=Marivita sp. S6314 TaxID=2926406 RepID=UPI001FF2C9A3|nr:FlgB family protein [Marivita sp. S6314]MCK0151413.1 FlgB family protein [Marivita sp. S6314]